MKPTYFVAIFGTDDHSPLFYASNPHPVISRKRAAYLLRAGRSRAPKRVCRTAAHSYFIGDCNLQVFACV